MAISPTEISGVLISSLGRVAEQMGDLEHAISAYENALRHNPLSLSGLTQVAGIARIKENYPKVGKTFFVFFSFLFSFLVVYPMSSEEMLLATIISLLLSPDPISDRTRAHLLMSSNFPFRQSTISSVYFSCKKTTVKYGVRWVSAYTCPPSCPS